MGQFCSFSYIQMPNVDRNFLFTHVRYISSLRIDVGG